MQGAGGDGRATAVGFEFSIFNNAVIVNLNLQTHYVAASWSANHSGSNIVVLGIEYSNIARVLVVIKYLFAISHIVLSLPVIRLFELVCRPLDLT